MARSRSVRPAEIRSASRVSPRLRNNSSADSTRRSSPTSLNVRTFVTKCLVRDGGSSVQAWSVASLGDLGHPWYAGIFGVTAKMLEILRMNPGEVMGETQPAFDLHTVTLPATPGTLPAVLSFQFIGDTGTTLVVPLPRPVGPGESVTVNLEFTFHLPKKQGRWGVWCGTSAPDGST